MTGVTMQGDAHAQCQFEYGQSDAGAKQCGGVLPLVVGFVLFGRTMHQQGQGGGQCHGNFVQAQIGGHATQKVGHDNLYRGGRYQDGALAW